MIKSSMEELLKPLPCMVAVEQKRYEELLEKETLLDLLVGMAETNDDEWLRQEICDIVKHVGKAAKS